MKNTLRIALSLGALALTACNGLPESTVIGGLGNLGTGTGTGSGTTLHGSVASPQDKLRVGLLAQPQAGGSRVELVSASASNGSYALVLPSTPSLSFQESTEDKSFVFALTSYVDVNGNNSYDSGDRVVDDGSSGASFRWFAADGPSYKAGWNVYDASSGTYTQSFDVAYAL